MAAVIKIPWTEEELELLRETRSVDAYMREALTRGYTYRTPGTVRFQLTKHKLTSGPRTWKEEEIQILRRVYPEEGVDAVVNALRLRGYHRSRDGVGKYVTKLGIANRVQDSRPWTEEEEDLLIRHYPWATNEQVRLLMEDAGFTRTERAIQQKAYTLGMLKGKDYYWS